MDRSGIADLRLVVAVVGTLILGRLCWGVAAVVLFRHCMTLSWGTVGMAVVLGRIVLEDH